MTINLLLIGYLLFVLPDFITKKDFEWAVETASIKKKMDCSCAEFITIDEGIMCTDDDIGPFDDEPISVSSYEQIFRRKWIYQ